jgi:hypothetical protein
MADKFAGEAVHSLHFWGCSVRADATMKFATAEEPGRADLVVMKRGRGCFVEVKNGRDSFAFSELRENQRQWIETIALPIYQTSVWIWLVLGSSPPHLDLLRYNIRQAWLCPYHQFLEVEAKVLPYSGSIPYRAGKGYRKELQENHLDAMHLLARFALRWKQGHWQLPQPHPFYPFVAKESETP